MRRLKRPPLSQTTLHKLAELTSKVRNDAKPRAMAAFLWRSKPTGPFDEVRSQLEAMASGRARCVYCEDGFGTDIDHFRPRAIYPLHAFSWPNYLLACSHCNSNLKRAEFPVDANGDPLLIDPSVDDPVEHLVFSPTTGEFVGSGTRGPESVRVFGLNDDTSPRRLPKGRRDALVGLVALLKEYDREVGKNPKATAEIRGAIMDYPFSAVLHWLVRIAQAPAGTAVLGAEVVALVRAHQVHTWL